MEIYYPHIIIYNCNYAIMLLQVFTLDEMTLIADLCKKHDVMVISDDVYEWLVYPQNEMIKMSKSMD